MLNSKLRMTHYLPGQRSIEEIQGLAISRFPVSIIVINRKLKAYNQAKQLYAIVSLYYPNLLKSSLAEIIERLSPCRHSPDYRSVKWFGVSYEFNATQAAIVAELWRAWENGTPRVGAGRLLSAMDCVSDKVSEIMKQNDAWGQMIKTDGRGNYWLQGPV